jgi:hypothetical protein
MAGCQSQCGISAEAIPFGAAIAKAELWGQISFGEVDTRSDDGICSFGSAYWI